jgi:hypothetical protein
MTLITLQGGKIVLREGKVGTEEACCCGGDLPECCEYCEGTATVYGQEVEISSVIGQGDSENFWTLVCAGKVDPPQLLSEGFLLFFSYAVARAWYECDAVTGKLVVKVRINAFGIAAGENFYSEQDLEDFAAAYDAAVLGSKHETPLVEVENEGPHSTLPFQIQFGVRLEGPNAVIDFGVERVFTSLGAPGFECIEGPWTEDETKSTYVNTYDFDSFPCLTEHSLSTKTDLNVNVTCSNNPLP